MTYPSVRATGTESNVTGVTSVNVAYPTLAAGDYLLLFANIGSAASSVVAPSGFSTLYNVKNGNTFICFYKVATGSETGTATITWTSATGCDAKMTSIKDASSIEVATATGSSINPDSPSLTASWGGLDNFWISVAHNSSSNFSAFPANYTALSSWGVYAGTGVSRQRSYTSSTDNPSAYTLSASSTWLAATLVFKPITSGGLFFGSNF